MVNDRAIHRSQHAVRNIRGTRNLEKMPTRMNQFWFRQSYGVPKSVMGHLKTARSRKRTDSLHIPANPAASFSSASIPRTLDLARAGCSVLLRVFLQTN